MLLRMSRSQISLYTSQKPQKRSVVFPNPTPSNTREGKVWKPLGDFDNLQTMDVFTLQLSGDSASHCEYSDNQCNFFIKLETFI